MKGPRVHRFCRDCGQTLTLNQRDEYVTPLGNAACIVTGETWHRVSSIQRERTADDPE